MVARERRTLYAGAHRRHHAHGLEAGVERQPLLSLGGAAKVPARMRARTARWRIAARGHAAAGAAAHGAGPRTGRSAGRSWGGAAGRACLRCS